MRIIYSSRNCLAFPLTEWLFGTRMHRVSKSFHALVLGWILLVGGPLVQSASAQDGKRSADAPPLSAHQRSRSSGNIPVMTGRLARSLVPDRAAHPT